MGKLITYWGMNGSGKTSLAVHTALEYAAKGEIVGILSCNTTYGYLQRVLGCSIPKEKSIATALLKPEDQVVRECIVHIENLDLFIMSLADEDDVMSLTNISDDDAESFISILKNKFDYLIVDGTDRPNDILVYSAFKQSDLIIEIVKPSLQGITYHNAHSVLINKIIDESKYGFIINGNQGYISKDDVIETCEGQPIGDIPFVNALLEKETIGEIYNIKHRRFSKRLKLVLGEMEKRLKEVVEFVEG